MPDPDVDLVLDEADGDLSAYMRDLANDCKADYDECGSANEYEESLVLSGAAWSFRDMAALGASQATELIGAYPNPFNPSTAIDHSLHRKSHVRLLVYDMLGHRVAVLEDAVRPEGRYSARFDASQLRSGAYVVRMETP